VREALALILIAVAGVTPGWGGGNEAEQAPSELVGVIVAVEESDGRIRAFTLRAGDEEYDVFIADDVDYGFDLHHLREHRTSGEPVRCRLEERGERLYALEILDA
jgi:hypothetical protein